jgi:hypothetical protein
MAVVCSSESLVTARCSKREGHSLNSVLVLPFAYVGYTVHLQSLRCSQKQVFREARFRWLLMNQVVYVCGRREGTFERQFSKEKKTNSRHVLGYF